MIVSKARTRILIIDDDASIRKVARRMLDRLGFDALEASDGSGGVRALLEGPGEIAAILLDLNMPEVDGRATLAALREQRSELPVLLMSGELQARDAALAEDAHTAFLPKPFRLAALETALAGLLSQAPSSIDAPAVSPNIRESAR